MVPNRSGRLHGFALVNGSLPQQNKSWDGGVHGRDCPGASRMFPPVLSALRGAAVVLALGLVVFPAGVPGRAWPEEPPGEKKDARQDETFRQQLARLGVDQWHKAGLRGRGVKVLVLDYGFPGYRDLLGKTLPREVTAQSFRDDGNLRAP